MKNQSRGIIPAFEIMNMTPAIRNMIMDNKHRQINNAISSGAADCMISMNQYITNLIKEGKIDEAVAKEYME